MMSPAVGELQAALLLPPGLARINDAGQGRVVWRNAQDADPG